MQITVKYFRMMNFNMPTIYHTGSIFSLSIYHLVQESDQNIDFNSHSCTPVSNPEQLHKHAQKKSQSKKNNQAVMGWVPCSKASLVATMDLSAPVRFLVI